MSADVEKLPTTDKRVRDRGVRHLLRQSSQCRKEGGRPEVRTAARVYAQVLSVLHQKVEELQ